MTDYVQLATGRPKTRSRTPKNPALAFLVSDIEIDLARMLIEIDKLNGLDTDPAIMAIARATPQTSGAFSESPETKPIVRYTSTEPPIRCAEPSLSVDNDPDFETVGEVFLQNSDKVGNIGQIYLDDATGAPSWVTVRTGLFGTSEIFVPLKGGWVDGNDVYVDFAEDKIKNAPRIDPDGSLSPEEETELYRYYGLSDGDSDSDSDKAHTDYDTRADDHVEANPTMTVAGDLGSTDADAPLDGTATRESGGAQLHRYVTTDAVTEMIPVRHDEVTLEREPISEADSDSSQSGHGISEEAHEVVLHEEVPVVDKDIVFVERVKPSPEDRY